MARTRVAKAGKSKQKKEDQEGRDEGEDEDGVGEDGDDPRVVPAPFSPRPERTSQPLRTVPVLKGKQNTVSGRVRFATKVHSGFARVVNTPADVPAAGRVLAVFSVALRSPGAARGCELARTSQQALLSARQKEVLGEDGGFPGFGRLRGTFCAIIVLLTECHSVTATGSIVAVSLTF